MNRREMSVTYSSENDDLVLGRVGRGSKFHDEIKEIEFGVERHRLSYVKVREATQREWVDQGGRMLPFGRLLEMLQNAKAGEVSIGRLDDSYQQIEIGISGKSRMDRISYKTKFVKVPM